MQTPQSGQDGQGRYFWQLGPFNNPAHAVNVLNFVFKLNATQWDNNNAQNWNISIKPAQDPNPVGANKTVSTTINTPYQFSTNDFQFTSPSGAAFAGIRLQSLPQAGSLSYNGSPAVTDIDYTEPPMMVFSPGSDASGSPYTSFSFKVKDSNGLYSLQNYTITINVVSPLPVGQNGSITMPINTSYTFSNANFPFSSPIGNSFGGIRIIALPSAGGLNVDGSQATTGKIVGNVNQMVYSPAAGVYGTPYTSFQFRLRDSQGLESQQTYNMTINVTANYPAGISWLPANPSTAVMITIVVNQDANMSANARLHWGVNNWTKPNEAYWPAGTTLWTDNVAARTPFTQSGNAWIVQLGPLNNGAQTVSSINFVIHYGGNNWNNNGQNWNINVCNPPAPTTLTSIVLNSQTIELNWNSPAGISEWSIRYGPQGFNPQSGGTLITNVTSRPQTISGLTPGTSYEFNVRAHCRLQGQSAWSQPHQVSLGGSSSQSLNFAEGYTWFSVNVNPGNMFPGNLFAGLNPCYDDRIIGQNSFALFNGSNWVGSLVNLNSNGMYKMKLCSARQHQISGIPAPLTPINLSAGFTWLGYSPQQCMGVNAALSGLNPGPSYDDRIIGQNSFALFNCSQWVGPLNQLCPGQGYIIKLSQNHTLTYPAASTNAGQAPGQQQSISEKGGVMVSSHLQHTMPVVARLMANGSHVIGNPNDVVYAFIDGVCTGAGTPDPDLGGLVLMSVGHNESQLRAVRFKLWLHSLQQLVSLSDSILFEPLKSAGTLNSPVVLNITGLTGLSERDAGQPFISQAWPNPSNNMFHMYVRIAESAVAELQLIDQLGRPLRNVGFRLVPGANEMKINVSDIKAGALSAHQHHNKQH